MSRIELVSGCDVGNELGEEKAHLGGYQGGDRSDMGFSLRKAVRKIGKGALKGPKALGVPLAATMDVMSSPFSKNARKFKLTKSAIARLKK